MLSSGFAAELDSSEPEQEVTGVINWRFSSPATPDRQAFLLSISEVKKPLLDSIAHIPNVRINPLTGLSQAIASAPARYWREFLLQNQWLREADEVEIVDNQPEFHTIP